MSLPLAEQIVVITGAGRGLGAQIARSFHREGARVAINYRRSRSKAEELAHSLGERAMAVQADIREADAVVAMIAAIAAQWGEVTTVVHNALADYQFNGNDRTPLDRLTAGELEAQFATAVIGAVNITQATLPGMTRRGFGRIVHVGSNLVQNPVVPYHDYTAAKGALLALTRTSAAELGPRGITVNMISGGLLRTTDASAATPSDVFDLIAANTPIRRVTTPVEAADAVLLFASPWARAITGQNLIVDGGLVFG